MFVYKRGSQDEAAPRARAQFCVPNTEWVAEVRAATPDDACEVASIHVRAWQVAYRGLLPQEYLDGLRPEDRARRYTFGRTGPEHPAALVAVEHGVICGFVITGPSHDSDLQDARELWAIYVDPQRWGIGVGRLLMAAARDRLCQDGAREALLWVLAGNNRARRFYQLDGWNCDGSRRTEVIGGVTAEELRYRRPLP